LFQQYISQSGSAIANWGIDPDPVKAATDIGVAAGCTDTEINALTQCLMTVDAVTLNIAFMSNMVCEKA
jgi:Carboxylesterase family